MQRTQNRNSGRQLKYRGVLRPENWEQLSSES